MIDRRDFLKRSMAAAAIIPAAATTSNFSRSDTKTAGVQYVIVDEEFEDSVAFANTLTALGAKPYSVRHDLGCLWFGELGAKFKTGSSIAGLTTHSELHICESFARLACARVRFRGEHDCRGVDFLTHSLRAPESLSGLSTLLAHSDSTWPVALAMNLGRASTSDETLREERRATTTLRTASHPGSLFSWLIA